MWRKGGTKMSNLFVLCLGLGTVFFGLICIIFICKIMSVILGAVANKPAAQPAPAVAAAPAVPAAIPNRQEFIAAVSAVIAEDLGTDVSKIRILSVKKI